MSKLARPLGSGTDAKARIARAFGRGDYAAVVRAGNQMAHHRRLPASVVPMMAASFARLGDPGKAIEMYRAAIIAAPDEPANHRHLAELLHSTGNLDAAKTVCLEALALFPGDTDLLMLHGNVLRDTRSHHEALVAYGQVIARDPRHVGALHEIAMVLAALGQIDGATEVFCTILLIDPAHVSALRNLGQILTMAGRLDEAVNIFRLALERDPGNGFLRLRKAYQQMHICDWSEFGEAEPLLEDPDAIRDAGTPFVTLALADDPAVQLRHATEWSRQLQREAGSTSPPAIRPVMDGAPIRVGLLSGDFHDHATMFLIAGMLRERDRAGFELHAWSHGPDCPEHAMRRLMIDHVDSFSDISGIGDAEAAGLIRSAGLDILIDLKGYTQNARNGILARRPAPLQINYLGFPGSMGADFIDYLVADDIVVPPAERDHYAEHVIYLPGSYQPNDDRRAIAPGRPTRAELGLPDRGFVFCCFNLTYKITPAEFDVWMRLLLAVEGSVLWLLDCNPWARANLANEAVRRGVDPARLIFAGKLPQAEHLARIAVADLFLDTFRVNAHTTMSDALWAGLPAVTLAGRQFAARVGASVLAAAGQSGLITGTVAEYERLCLELATDPDRLTEIRSRLVAVRRDCSLFDTRGYTRAFEAGLRAVCDRARAGLPPADIHISRQ